MALADYHESALGDDVQRAISCLRLGILCVLLLLAAFRPPLAQSDTTNFPLPAAAELAALQPFVGVYEPDDNFWERVRGTLEVRPPACSSTAAGREPTTPSAPRWRAKTKPGLDRD